MSASIARFDDIVVLVRTFGTWGCLVGSVVIIPVAGVTGFHRPIQIFVLTGVTGPLQQFFFLLPPRRFIWGIILIAVAGDAGFLFDRYPLMFTCQTGRTSHLGFPLLYHFPLHHLHLYQFVGIGGEAGKSGSESTLPARGLHYRDIAEFAEGAPPCILACRGVRRLRGFKVAKVLVAGSTGFRGFGEVAVFAGPTIWFVGHFLLMYFLMVSITHRVNRARAHRAIAPHARMSVIPTNIVMVSRLV